MSKPRKPKGGGKGKPAGKQAGKQGAKRAPKPAAGTQAADAPSGADAPQAQAQAQAGDRKLTREERWELARRAKRRRELFQRALIVVVLVAIVGAIVGWQVLKRRNESQAISVMTAGSCEFDRKSDPGAVNVHSNNATFQVEPPAGGVHSPSAASPGVYIEQRPPGDSEIVHALEHGDIALWYRPDLPDDDVATLRDLAEEYETDILVIPRPQLPVSVAATAWHKRLLCNELERPALERFITRYSDKGPEGKTD